MLKKHVVIFIEGDTEVAFYKKLFLCLKERCPNQCFNCSLELKNLKGIGNYKKKALNIFCKQILPKVKDKNIYVVLCYDNDVFDFAQKPPVNWKNVKKDLMDSGAKEVYLVSAKQSIEDWFLYDKENVIKFLNLPSKTKITGKNGNEKLKRLYKQSNKIYIKGTGNDDLVENLNIEKIACTVCEDIRPLCRVLGVVCEELKLKRQS